MELQYNRFKMNIQQRINSLQPYVVQIRFVNGTSVVDTVFKQGWRVPQSSVIQSVKGDDEATNYHMFFTEKEELGIDDILDYIEQVIEINVEREKKYELLKVKTEELKELFKKNPLNKLQNMKFVLGGESLVPETMPEDFDEISMEDIDDEIPQREIEEPVNNVRQAPQTKPRVEEPVVRIRNQEVELPPKGEKIEVESFDEPIMVCKCGPDDVCPICVEEKMGAE